MISHRHRCIFIHIPKCAGTSIEAALGHLDGYDGRDAQDHRSIRMVEQPLFTRGAFASLENLREVVRRIRVRLRRSGNPKNALRVTKAQYRDYFKFTIVRNPWERVYSAYRNVMRDWQQQRIHGLSEPIPLDAFVERFAGRHLIKPQLYYLRNFAGAIPLDFIGRFEGLTADFQEACRRMGLEPPPELPHRLRSAGGDHRAAYDDATAERVGRLYAEEIAHFGYRF